MARYMIAPGRAIGKKGGGVYRHGDALPPLSASDIDRFVADGSLVPVPGFVAIDPADTPEPQPAEVDPAPEAEPQAAEPGDPASRFAPSAVSPPPETDAGSPSAGFDVPDKWPSIKRMPAFLEGKSAAEVRFLQANDSRVSPASEKVYTDALAALEAE